MLIDVKAIFLFFLLPETSEKRTNDNVIQALQFNILSMTPHLYRASSIVGTGRPDPEAIIGRYQQVGRTQSNPIQAKPPVVQATI